MADKARDLKKKFLFSTERHAPPIWNALLQWGKQNAGKTATHAEVLTSQTGPDGQTTFAVYRLHDNWRGEDQEELCDILFKFVDGELIPAFVLVETGRMVNLYPSQSGKTMILEVETPSGKIMKVIFGLDGMLQQDPVHKKVAVR